MRGKRVVLGLVMGKNQFSIGGEVGKTGITKRTQAQMIEVISVQNVKEEGEENEDSIFPSHTKADLCFYHQNRIEAGKNIGSGLQMIKMRPQAEMRGDSGGTPSEGRLIKQECAK